MSLWPFQLPGDDGLERLRERYAKTLNANVLREEIARASKCGDLDPVEVAAVHSRPLGIKKDRFLVLVDVETPDGRLELVAKGYCDDRARRVIDNHRLLWVAGLGGSSAPVRTSRPLGVLGGLGVTLSERLPGEHPEASDPTSAELAGKAAAFLHSRGAPLEPRFDLDQALHNVERHARSLERREPSLARGAVAVALRARFQSDGFPEPPASPLHGDFSVGSLLLDGTTAYLLDWDISCRFDPAWDVGYYLVQLRRFGLEQGVDTSAARERFLSAYLAAAGANGALTRRVDYHHALVCVHKAYTARLLQGPNWRRVVQELLRLADAGLSEIE
jgi:hypothetical protein